MAITTRVMSLVHEVLSKGIHVTKRDLFYTGVGLRVGVRVRVGVGVGVGVWV